MSNSENPQSPIEVPADQLSRDTIDALIESFILREGTDYGTEEVALSQKMKQVRRQLEKKEIKIVFDAESESVTLMTDSEWRKYSRN